MWAGTCMSQVIVSLLFQSIKALRGHPDSSEICHPEQVWELLPFLYSLNMYLLKIPFVSGTELASVQQVKNTGTAFMEVIMQWGKQFFSKKNIVQLVYFSKENGNERKWKTWVTGRSLITWRGQGKPLYRSPTFLGLWPFHLKSPVWPSYFSDLRFCPVSFLLWLYFCPIHIKAL